MRARPTTAEDRRLGTYRLTGCLGSPEVPEVAGGMPLGAQVIQLDVDFYTVFRNPSVPQFHLWRALVTPYDAAGTLNTAAPYELRGLVPVPQRLVLKGRYDKSRKQAVVTGSLDEAGDVQSGIVVYVYAGLTISTMRPLGTVKTTKNGTFALRKRMTKTSLLWAEVPIYFDECANEPAVVAGAA